MRHHAIFVVLFCALGSAQTFSIVTQFDGSTGTGTIQQPNSNIGSNGTQLMQMNGQTVSYWNTNGTAISSLTFDTWLANASPSVTVTNIRAPRFVYDSFISRWVVVAGNIHGDNVYVSSSSDPSTSTWKDVTLGGALGSNGDLTMRVAFDKNGVYVTEFDQSVSPLTYTWYAIPGADLVWTGAGTPSLANLQTMTAQGYEANCQPDPNTSKAVTDPEYCVYHSNPRVSGTGSSFNWDVKYWTWPSGGVGGACTDGVGTAPCATLSTQQALASGFKFTSTTATTNQPSPGNPVKDSESVQSFATFLSGNHLYALTASGPCTASCGAPGADTNNKVIWVDLNVANPNAITIAQEGQLTDPNFAYIFPALAADSSGNLVITAQGWSATSIPTTYIWNRLTTMAASSMNGPNALLSGTNAYVCASLNPVPWGKYFNGAQDPSDGTKIWLVGQYGKSASDCVWQTRIAEVTFSNTPNGTSPAVAILAGMR